MTQQMPTIRKAFSLSGEQLAEMTEAIREEFPYTSFQEIVADTLEEIKAHTVEDPKEKAAWDNLNKLDKMMFVARELFCTGYQMGLLHMREGIEQTLDELEQGKEDF